MEAYAWKWKDMRGNGRICVKWKDMRGNENGYVVVDVVYGMLLKLFISLAF